MGYLQDGSNRGSMLRAAAAALLLIPLLAACATNSNVPHVKRSAFSSKDYGAVSPRVTNAKNPKHGGGRYMVGDAYRVHGKTYTPMANPVGYVQTGEASWYGADFHGRLTANGEIFSANAITGAHPTLPLPCYVRVTNVQNGRSMIVRVNDRGPYLPGRIMDVSYKVADILGFAGKGTGEIQVAYVGPAPLNGDDTRMLMASVNRTTNLDMQAETRFALAETPKPRVQVAPKAPASGARVNFADLTSQQSGTLGTISSDDPVADLIGVMGYQEPPHPVAADPDSAIAAAEAMATRSGDIQGWMESIDESSRAIRLGLGDFRDPEQADGIAEAFAMLGAVDEDDVALPGGPATRLTLTHLKPGVARDDVMALVRKLGLKDVSLD